MLLNARKNGFVFLFPPDFFTQKVTEKYSKYFKNLILPYDTIDDFMSSTVQSIDFPGFDMKEVEQIRPLGKRQGFKNATQVIDLYQRTFSITFKLTDAYLNYFIFMDNSLEFLDFNNKEQTYGPMRLILLDNQGYAISSMIFKSPILTSQEGLKFSYSSATPDFGTFTAKFSYFDFELELDFD